MQGKAHQRELKQHPPFNPHANRTHTSILAYLVCKLSNDRCTSSDLDRLKSEENKFGPMTIVEFAQKLSNSLVLHGLAKRMSKMRLMERTIARRRQAGQSPKFSQPSLSTFAPKILANSSYFP